MKNIGACTGTPHCDRMKVDLRTSKGKFCSKTCLVGLLIRSIFRWKIALALQRECSFFSDKSNDVLMNEMVSQFIIKFRLFTNRLSKCRSKKVSGFRATCFYEGNSPVTVEFPAHRASDAANVFIWWCHRNDRTIEASGSDQCCSQKFIISQDFCYTRRQNVQHDRPYIYL